jgi:hypothetical protein
MEKLFECKYDDDLREIRIIESSFYVVLCAVAFVAEIVKHKPWWFAFVIGILFLWSAIVLRNRLFGGIVVGVEDDNLVIHRKYWPHHKDKRIPLNDIAGVVVQNPLEAENYIDYDGPLYNVQLQTQSGATYDFEDQLTPKQLEILQDFVGENCGDVPTESIE